METFESVEDRGAEFYGGGAEGVPAVEVNSGQRCDQGNTEGSKESTVIYKYLFEAWLTLWPYLFPRKMSEPK
jgi:hypothetical protein